MSRDSRSTRGRTRDGVRLGDGRPIHYEPVESSRPVEPARGAAVPDEGAAMEPNEVVVERRAGTERRVADQPVDVERRMADRRAALQQEQLEARERRRYAVGRATQAVDYIFILLYGLLGIRFFLALLGASEQAGFVSLVNGLTEPFYAPFAGIVARPAANGGYLDFPLLIAILAYALLHLAVRGLLRLVGGARTVP